MNRFDRIDILCPYNEKTMDTSNFNATKHNSGELISSLYPVDVRYKNDIGISYNRYAFNQKGTGELKVSVTSKVLGERYPEKIHSQNLEHCLNNVLDKVGEELFNPKELIFRGYSNHIHVTHDLKLKIGKDEYRAANSLLKKPNSWSADDTRHSSWSWRSKRKAAKDKQMFSSYDKENQMEKTEQKEFMKEHHIPLDTFNGVSRLELKLYSPEAIRQGFGIPDNKITSIITASNNPIVTFIEKTFDLSDNLQQWHSLKKVGDSYKIAFIEKYDGDMERVEQEIRRIDPTNASKIMKQLRAINERYLQPKDNRSKGVALLTNIVDMINHDRVFAPYYHYNQAA